MRRLTTKGALLAWGALFLLPIVSQTIKPPRLYVYYALPGDTSWSWLSIVIDSPLTLTRDSSGQAHLGISLPSFADNEVPAGTLDGVNAVFTLANTPSPPSSLRIVFNGVQLNQGTDYSLSGKTITFSGIASGSVMVPANGQPFTGPIIRFGSTTAQPGNGEQVIGTIAPMIPGPADLVQASYRY